MSILEQIPKELIDFTLVALFSFLFGLEQRKHHTQNESETVFGTDRTFTLIGILGYVLYFADKKFTLYLAGGIALAVLLAIFYWQKASQYAKFGITSIIVAFITYSLAPLVVLAKPWLTMLVVVVTLILVESKEELRSISSKFDKYEFTTLAKFIIIAGVILPLLPNEPLSSKIDITPYHFWLAIVAVSGISYFSYLLKKFVFPDAGIMLTAVLGGLYSSTATTVILSKKSALQDPYAISAGIIAATGVMYIRIWILALIFNIAVARQLLPFFALFVVVDFAIASYIYAKRTKNDETKFVVEADKNPLEFKTALIFGALFTFFALLSHYVLKNYGDLGVGILSLIVGVTDIDPYLLSIFQSADIMAVKLIVLSTILATTSNNIAKMTYALLLGTKQIKPYIISGFSLLVVLGLILAAVSWFVI
jgi:uncharacterized membrane protein (DUF4010 family)